MIELSSTGARIGSPKRIIKAFFKIFKNIFQGRPWVSGYFFPSFEWWEEIGTIRAGLSKGLRGAIAQVHHKIGGTTLADCEMDILVAYIIFLKGTCICDLVMLINLPL